MNDDGSLFARKPLDETSPVVSGAKQVEGESNEDESNIEITEESQSATAAPYLERRENNRNYYRTNDATHSISNDFEKIKRIIRKPSEDNDDAYGISKPIRRITKGTIINNEN